MARFNEILAGRYNRLLQKLFSMKGPPPAPQLSSEINVAFPLFSGAEHRYLESWNRFGFGANVLAGGAGNFSAFRMANPATSGVVAVIERFQIAEAVADILGILGFFAALTTITNPSNRTPVTLDTRGSGSILQLQTSTNAGAIAIAAGQQLWNPNLQANLAQEFIITDIQEFPLLPGSTLIWEPGANNQAFTVTVLWRERALEDSEKF